MEKIYRELESGEIVKGIGLPAFIHNMQYHCVLIKIYEDGVIDCWEKVNFEKFVEKVKIGWVVTKLPAGGNISRFHSFYGKTDGLNSFVEEGEFIKEVRDTLDALQGKPTSSERCRKSFLEFIKNPTEKLRKEIDREYGLVPDHLKRYVLGDMDSKDGPLKFILSNKKIAEDKLSYWRERYGNS